VLAGIVLLAFGFSISRGLFFNQQSYFTAAVLPHVLVELANEDRAAEGLGALTVNPVLEDAARMKAEHMAENGYFAHKSPDGLDPWYWFYRAGYQFSNAGENLAVNFSDSDDVNQAWLDSPGHRANIMNGTFTEVGIAAAPGVYKGKKTVFVVQLFGTPMAVAATPAPVAPAVAGASELEPVSTPVVAEAPEPTLIKEDLTARIEGVAVAEASNNTPVTAERVEGSAVSVWDSAVAQPRATVSLVYILASLLVSFVLLCMVFVGVHRRHTHSMLYGVALLALILALSYFNWLLISADLVIA
jgi:hypothetical protein